MMMMMSRLKLQFRLATADKLDNDGVDGVGVVEVLVVGAGEHQVLQPGVVLPQRGHQQVTELLPGSRAELQQQLGAPHLARIYHAQSGAVAANLSRNLQVVLQAELLQAGHSHPGVSGEDDPLVKLPRPSPIAEHRNTITGASPRTCRGSRQLAW